MRGGVVADGVHHPNLDTRPGEADGPDRLAAHGLVPGEDAFDGGAHPGTLAVDLARAGCQLPVAAGLAMVAAAPSVGLEQVRFVEQAREHAAVVAGGIGRLPAVDEAERPIHLDMVLAAVVAHAVLARPACIDALVAALFRRSAVENPAGLDRRVVGARIALSRRPDDAGVDDPPLPGDIALVGDLRRQFGEQRVERPRRLQAFAEPPDRLRIGHGAFGAEAEKARERVAVSYLELGPVVAQVVQLPQHQDLEHQDADLPDNRALSETAAWTGALLGVWRPDAHTVAGDTRLAVDLRTLDGTLDFTSPERWGAEAAPGAAGTGTVCGDGDLGYTVRVTGNGFERIAGDDGEIVGSFFGPAHEGIGGVLERADLAAGFGGNR